MRKKTLTQNCSIERVLQNVLPFFGILQFFEYSKEYTFSENDLVQNMEKMAEELFVELFEGKIQLLNFFRYFAYFLKRSKCLNFRKSFAILLIEGLKGCSMKLGNQLF